MEEGNQKNESNQGSEETRETLRLTQNYKANYFRSVVSYLR